jgi:hypothetical protein
MKQRAREKKQKEDIERENLERMVWKRLSVICCAILSFNQIQTTHTLCPCMYVFVFTVVVVVVVFPASFERPDSAEGRSISFSNAESGGRGEDNCERHGRLFDDA